jgi:hypothetical protein
VWRGRKRWQPGDSMSGFLSVTINLVSTQSIAPGPISTPSCRRLSVPSRLQSFSHGHDDCVDRPCKEDEREDRHGRKPTRNTTLDQVRGLPRTHSPRLKERADVDELCWKGGVALSGGGTALSFKNGFDVPSKQCFECRGGACLGKLLEKIGQVGVRLEPIHVGSSTKGCTPY